MTAFCSLPLCPTVRPECYVWLMFRYVAALLLLFGSLGFAQTTRQIYSGRAGGGNFNLVVSDNVPLGEEAFAVSLYESPGTMQLRRTPYSTTSYVYAGIDAMGTLHLQRRFSWPERDLTTSVDLTVELGTPLSFSTGPFGPSAEIVFTAGEKGRLRLRLVNRPPLERPQNLGF